MKDVSYSGYEQNDIRLPRKPEWLLFLVGLLIFSIFASLANPVSAASSRSAQIVSVTGSVEVKKAGGSKAFTAFADMYLNEGDLLTTGAGASVVLKVVDQEDEVTIGENSEVYISSLTEDGGKKSKIGMWAGSLWFKVKTLVSDEDEFEVETPTAVMGVRGSNGYVEMNAGGVTAWMASGILHTKSTINPDKQAYTYPGQQVLQIVANGGADETVANLPIDVKSFVTNASPSIIQDVLQTINEIRQENAQLIEQIGNGQKVIDPASGLRLNTLDALNQFNLNLDNLVANIAKTAIDEKVLPEDQVREIIDQVNSQNPKNPIDLDNVRPYDPNVGLDPSLQQPNQEELDRLKELLRVEEARRAEQLEQKKRQMQELLDTWKQQTLIRNEANQAAEEELNRQAAIDHAAKNQTPDNEPDNPPISGGGGGSSGGGGSDDGDDGGEGNPPSVRVASVVAPSNVNVNETFMLRIYLSEFTGVYGVQANVAYDSSITLPPGTTIASQIVSANETLVEQYEQVEGTNNMNELIYTFVVDASAESPQPINIGQNELLAEIPLHASELLQGSEIHVFVKVVDEEGNVIPLSRQLMPVNIHVVQP